jgi:hypothetical protein
VTGHPQLAITPRDSFLSAVKEEFVAFEKKERLFQKTLRNERADELGLPPMTKAPPSENAYDIVKSKLC